MIEWRPVAGFPDYEVSSDGQVRSRKRPWVRAERVLRCIQSPRGYRSVSLVRDRQWRKYKRYRVAALVLNAFVGPRPSDRHEVENIDGNRFNDAVKNLRWVTRPEASFRLRRQGITPEQARSLLFCGSNGVPKEMLRQSTGVSRRMINALLQGKVAIDEKGVDVSR